MSESKLAISMDHFGLEFRIKKMRAESFSNSHIRKALKALGVWPMAEIRRKMAENPR